MMIKTFGLILFFSSSLSKNLFMPNLPMGEYKLAIDKMYQCAESTKNHPMHLNIFVSKNTSSITELKGNLTSIIPFDDALKLDINFASWGSTGGWIPNSNIIKSKKACSSVKHLYGTAWNLFAKGFNMTNICPVPVGTYVTSGIDFKKLDDNNFPKVYFYGKYKLSLMFKNVENKIVSCIIVEINIIRPWETPI